MSTRSSRRSAAVAASAAIYATVAHVPPPSPLGPSPPRRARAARTLAKRVSYKEIPIDADLVRDDEEEEEEEEQEAGDEQDVVVKTDGEDGPVEEEGEGELALKTATPVETPARPRNRKGAFRSRVRQRSRASGSATPATLATKGSRKVGKSRAGAGTREDGEETGGEGDDEDALMGTPEVVAPKKTSADAAATIVSQWLKYDVNEVRLERESRMITFRDKGVSVYETEHVEEAPPQKASGSGVTSRAMSAQSPSASAPAGMAYPFPQIDKSLEFGKKPDGPVEGESEVIVESEEVTLRKRGVKRRRKDVEPGVVRGVYEPHTHMLHVPQDLQATHATTERLNPLPLVTRHGEAPDSFNWPNTTSGYTAFSSTLGGEKVGRYGRGVMSIEYVMEDGWGDWVEEVKMREQMVKDAEKWAEKVGERATVGGS